VEADAQVSMHEDDKDANGEVEEESVQRAKGKRTVARGRKLVSFLSLSISIANAFLVVQARAAAVAIARVASTSESAVMHGMHSIP